MMDKKIERTVAGVDNLIDGTRNVVVGAADRAEQGVGNLAEKVAEKSSVANEYVRAGAEKVAEKASVASEYVRAGAESGTRAAHQRLHDAADAIDRGYTRVRSDLSRAADAATDYVAQNSGKAVLMAASAGFLIGFLATRRRTLPAGI